MRVKEGGGRGGGRWCHTNTYNKNRAQGPAVSPPKTNSLLPPSPSASLQGTVEAKGPHFPIQCKPGVCVYRVLLLQLQLEPQFPRLSDAGCYVRPARFSHQHPERQKNSRALGSTPNCMYVYNDL